MYAFKRLIRLSAAACVLVAAACASTSAPTPAALNTNNSVAEVANSNAAAQATALPPVQLPVDAQGAALVARVNGNGITKTALDRAIARLQTQQQAQDINTLQSNVLETLIQQQLIDQYATRQNIVVTDADIQTELATNIQIAGSDAAWKKWLADNLYTPDEFNTTVHDMLITSRIRDQITAPLAGVVSQVHARHILVATQAEAQGILDRLNKGEDFATLAKQYSKDVTTRDNGGDLGWFTQDELLEPNLAAVAFSSAPGTYAGPVATTLGFHIIQTIEKADRPIPDDKRATLAEARFENWLQSLYQGATIERYL